MDIYQPDDDIYHLDYMAPTYRNEAAERRFAPMTDAKPAR